MKQCLKCQANPENYKPNENKEVVGQYNYCFYKHCFEEWIKKQNNCPLLFKEWIQMKLLD
jgi:hypothetical protein